MREYDPFFLFAPREPMGLAGKANRETRALVQWTTAIRTSFLFFCGLKPTPMRGELARVEKAGGCAFIFVQQAKP
jgi:hypothetical protein